MLGKVVNFINFAGNLSLINKMSEKSIKIVKMLGKLFNCLFKHNFLRFSKFYRHFGNAKIYRKIKFP